MRGPYMTTSRAAGPIRALAHRLSLLSLFVAGAVLLMLHKANNPAVVRFEATVTDGVSIFLTVLASPVQVVQKASGWVGDVSTTYQQNRHLIADNAKLMEWEAVARRLENENARYRELLGVKPLKAEPFLTPRVVGDSGGSFVRAVILNAGAEDGLREGQAIIDAYGFAGHIVSVGLVSARALLATDLNSRIPVSIEGSGFRAILAGDNSSRPYLTFLSPDAVVTVGDRIVTSGDGGILPPGLAVGDVAENQDGIPRVRLLAHLDRLEFVRVLAYRAPNLREDDASIAGPEADGE